MKKIIKNPNKEKIMNDLGLAVEATKILTKADGATVKKRITAGIKITDVVLDEPDAKKIGKPAGRYITLEGEPDTPQMTLILEKAMRELICKSGRIFIAGLGNPDVTHDSLGALCARKVVPRKDRRYSVSAIETDVAARTGIDTARLVKTVANEISADCVIAIDALACENPRRIGKTVQLSDTGFVLGSGAGSDCGEISRGFLRIPTVAVGVPTMTALSSLTKKHTGNFLVTAADIDIIAEQWAEVISDAINGF